MLQNFYRQYEMHFTRINHDNIVHRVCTVIPSKPQIKYLASIFVISKQKRMQLTLYNKHLETHEDLHLQFKKYLFERITVFWSFKWIAAVQLSSACYSGCAQIWNKIANIALESCDFISFELYLRRFGYLTTEHLTGKEERSVQGR